MPDFNCKKLYEELTRLKQLKVEFDRAYEKWMEKRDFGECEHLYRTIKELMEGQTEIRKLRDLAVLRRLKLKEQYEAQVDVAWKSGLFEKTEGVESDVPVIERDGKKYPMPSWQEIKEVLRKPENLEIIKEKSAQGFTKMLIVPFGYDLKTMAEKFKEKVRELDQAGLNADGSSNPDKGIFGAGGEKVEFRRDDVVYPVFIWSGWEDGQIVYYPKAFDKQKHDGMTKEEVIALSGVWQICLVEDMPVIPEDGKEVGGRKQIDRKGSFYKDQSRVHITKKYKEMMGNLEALTGKHQTKKNIKYRYETGQTLEQYIWMQLNSLLEHERAILMDYEKNNWRGSFLVECFYGTMNVVAVANWNVVGKLELAIDQPSAMSSVEYGVRTSVNIK